jgi:hypothetical protein
MIDNVERIARTALWIALALAVIAVPIGVFRNQSAEAALRAEWKIAEAALRVELKSAEEKLAEMSKPKEPALFPLKSVGMYLGRLEYASAEGSIVFTNTTAKSGYLCLKGVATNVKTRATAESIAACREIKPFDSNVNMTFKFAGGDLYKACPQVGDCQFSTSSVEQP